MQSPLQNGGQFQSFSCQNACDVDKTMGLQHSEFWNQQPHERNIHTLAFHNNPSMMIWCDDGGQGSLNNQLTFWSFRSGRQ